MADPRTPQESTAVTDERRALDAEERQLADMARHPALGALSDRALSELISRLRSRRDRARDLADRQGREARAKAPPAGASPASGNAGTLSKRAHLHAALERAIAERAARSADQADEAPHAQHAMAQKALETARTDAGDRSPMMEDGAPLHPRDPDARKGKANLQATARHAPPSGAFDHAGELPSRERSRTRY